jgi:hypothetical protein
MMWVAGCAFAALCGGLIGAALSARAQTAPDPVARELARARREEASLAVASVALPARARLAQEARTLAARLRITDAVVRTRNGRLVVVLPRADHDAAMAVVGRALGERRAGALVGVAAFPDDARTWEALADAARDREQPWTAPVRSDRFVRQVESRQR